MNKNIFVGGFLMLVLLVGGAIAYQGDYTQKGPDYTEERHTLMEEAFDNNDYGTWKDVMTATGRNPRVVDVVTPENFPTFVAAHEAGERGDYEEASRLRAELGLGNGKGNGQSMHDGSGKMRDRAGQGNRDGARGTGDCSGAGQSFRNR